MQTRWITDPHQRDGRHDVARRFRVIRETGNKLLTVRKLPRRKRYATLRVLLSDSDLCGLPGARLEILKMSLGGPPKETRAPVFTMYGLRSV